MTQANNPLADLTPEQQSKAENLVKAVQANIAKRDAKAGRTDTRKERLEQTWGGDARKTREVVRQGHTSLPVLARLLVPFIGEQADKFELEAALDAYVVACKGYFTAEARPVKLIDWMGAPNGQVAVPHGAVLPEHKQQLIDAWHRLLRAVNTLSKVGIVKPQRIMLGEPTAIELLVDLEETPRPKLTSWD